MSTQKQFTIVPGFARYEYNGTMLRNVKTKGIMSLKKNGKYQILSDDDKNCDRSPEQIKELVKTSTKTVHISSDKEGTIIPSTKKIDLKITKKEKAPEGEKKKSTMFMVNLLFHQGVEKAKIIEQLNITNKVYLDCQWHYANRGYKEKIEKYLTTQK